MRPFCFIVGSESILYQRQRNNCTCCCPRNGAPGEISVIFRTCIYLEVHVCTSTSTSTNRNCSWSPALGAEGRTWGVGWGRNFIDIQLSSLHFRSLKDYTFDSSVVWELGNNGMVGRSLAQRSLRYIFQTARCQMVSTQMEYGELGYTTYSATYFIVLRLI